MLRRYGSAVLALAVAVYIATAFLGLPIAYTLLVLSILFVAISAGLVAAEKREAAEDFRTLAIESVSGVRQTLAVSAYVMLRGAKQDKTLKGKLEQAGSQISVLAWVGGVISLAFIVSVVMVFVLKTSISLLSFFGVIMAAYAALNMKAAKRVSAFDHALPMLFRSVSTTMKSGDGFESALRDAAATSNDESVRTEIGAALLLIAEGGDQSVHYSKTAERMDSAGFLLMSQAYSITRQAGGKLADILHSIADAIDDKHDLEAMIKALSAEGKLSAGILLMLPVGMYIAMRILNPEYAVLLTDNRAGLAMLAVCFIISFLGLMWIRNLITFKD